MSESATLVRSARNSAGLTQAELAHRLGTTQTAIARLERRGANPTIATLRKTLGAADHRLELAAVPRPSSVDLPQLIRHMRMTPAERLAAHQAAYDGMRELVGKRPARG
jgi:transcriptional regulator with XRE-family HTH domain